MLCNCDHARTYRSPACDRSRRGEGFATPGNRGTNRAAPNSAASCERSGCDRPLKSSRASIVLGGARWPKARENAVSRSVDSDSKQPQQTEKNGRSRAATGTRSRLPLCSHGRVDVYWIDMHGRRGVQIVGTGVLQVTGLILNLRGSEAAAPGAGKPFRELETSSDQPGN